MIYAVKPKSKKIPRFELNAERNQTQNDIFAPEIPNYYCGNLGSPRDHTLTSPILSTNFQHSKVRRRSKQLDPLIADISLEPVIFLFGFGWSILNSSKVHTYLLIWNISHLELDYNETICDDLSSENNTDNMTDVQTPNKTS